MLYAVRARPRTRELEKLWELLNDGTIRNQEPDGREIIASMERALIHGEYVEWYETCYCSPPLRHERATVYDHFFTDMCIERSETPAPLKGQPFWDHLQASNADKGTGHNSSLKSPTKYVPVRIL